MNPISAIISTAGEVECHLLQISLAPPEHPIVQTELRTLLLRVEEDLLEHRGIEVFRRRRIPEGDCRGGRMPRARRRDGGVYLVALDLTCQGSRDVRIKLSFTAKT